MTLSNVVDPIRRKWAQPNGAQATVGQRSIQTHRSYADYSVNRFQFLLTAYWAAFWLMNGLDKVFNGPNFFGITRDAKFADYFARIGLPEPVAMAALQGICVYEIALGVLFFVVLFGRTRWGAFDPTRLNLIALELSLALFVFFTLGDVLFGDRAELWEHSCYIALAILSYLVVHRFAPQSDDKIGGSSR